MILQTIFSSVNRSAAYAAMNKYEEALGDAEKDRFSCS